MAEIFPFRALHYNPQRVPDLGKTITQPYDKITSEMQARYYQLSPYNLVRIIRGLEKPDDSPQENVYTRAAHNFQRWIQEGILKSSPEPALYPYYQEFAVPGQPAARKQRRGFIALGRLEDYSSGIVHRHEETLSGPKADRLELLKATRAHFGQIFMLYSDPAGDIAHKLHDLAKEKLWERVEDEDGNAHSVWRVTDPLVVEKVTRAMRDKKLVIADGHHRYETALAYRNYCRTQSAPDDRSEYVMMTFIRKESDDLTILPTHRVVDGLTRFDWSKFSTAVRKFFHWKEVQGKGAARDWLPQFIEKLAQAGREAPALGAYAGSGRLALLRLRQDTDLGTTFADLAPSLRCLDVIVLHRLLIEGVLGIDREAVQKERNLRYVREPELTLELVDTGQAQVSFLMNPTSIGAVWENALAGQVLPQKSTDFYPKLLSGLTIYWLDNPAGM